MAIDSLKGITVKIPSETVDKSDKKNENMGKAVDYIVSVDKNGKAKIRGKNISTIFYDAFRRLLGKNRKKQISDVLDGIPKKSYKEEKFVVHVKTFLSKDDESYNERNYKFPEVSGYSEVFNLEDTEEKTIRLRYQYPKRR